MGVKFPQNLGLTPEEQDKIARLGISTPAAFLAMRRAAQEPFDNLFGKDRADEIASRIETELTPEEREHLASGAPRRHFPLGALLGDPPKLVRPKFDIEERDRLFNELQALRGLSTLSADQKYRITQLEAMLNALFEPK